MNEYSKIWPEGKKCAVMLSVNLDAEFYGRIYYPGINVDEGDIMRLGKTGMEFGLPRLLDTLDNYGVKATFFIWSGCGPLPGPGDGNCPKRS